MSEHYHRHSIVVHPFKLENGDLRVNYRVRHVLKEFNYPVRVIKKWGWYLTYYKALMQVRFPRHYVCSHVYSYTWPPEDDRVVIRRQIASAKAQVSKIYSIMKMRRRELAKELFNDEDSDPVLTKCREKLKEKQHKLNQLLT